jgi:hypothetical protein
LTEQKGLVAKLGEDVTAKSARLAELTTRADALRKQAIEFFTRSAQHSAAASTEGKTLWGDAGKWLNEHPTAPERKAWEQLRTTYSPQVFKLSEAEAENALASVHSAYAAQLEARQKLVASISKDLQDGGVTVPPSLSATTDDPAKVTQSANAAYASAADKFLTVYSGLPGNALKDVKDAAHVARMFSLYGQFLNGDQAKLGDAKKEFQETFGDRKDDPMVKLLPAKLQG